MTPRKRINTSIQIDENYCFETDTTFLMKEIYIADGDTWVLKSREVIGFYSGEPNPKDTEYYSNKPSLKAEYTL